MTLTPNLNVSLDAVILFNHEDQAAIYVQKENGQYKLPGVLFQTDETTDLATKRLTATKIRSGLHNKVKLQTYLHPKTDVNRDSRGRVIGLAALYTLKDGFEVAEENVLLFEDFRNLSKDDFMYDHYDIVLDALIYTKEHLFDNKENLFTKVYSTYRIKQLHAFAQSVNPLFSKQTVSNFISLLERETGLNFRSEVVSTYQSGRGPSEKVFDMKHIKKL